MQCREGGAHRCGEREWHRRGREGRGTGTAPGSKSAQRIRRYGGRGRGKGGRGRGGGGEVTGEDRSTDALG